jgi:hypothetical protein
MLHARNTLEYQACLGGVATKIVSRRAESVVQGHIGDFLLELLRYHALNSSGGVRHQLRHDYAKLIAEHYSFVSEECGR